MSVHIRCPFCDQAYEIDDFVEGAEAECQKCGNSFQLSMSLIDTSGEAHWEKTSPGNSAHNYIHLQDVKPYIPHALRLIQANPQETPSVALFMQKLNLDEESAQKLLLELEHEGYIGPVLDKATGTREIA